MLKSNASTIECDTHTDLHTHTHTHTLTQTQTQTLTRTQHTQTKITHSSKVTYRTLDQTQRALQDRSKRR